jgi:hypothetical protein
MTDDSRALKRVALNPRGFTAAVLCWQMEGFIEASMFLSFQTNVGCLIQDPKAEISVLSYYRGLKWVEDPKPKS